MKKRQFKKVIKEGQEYTNHNTIHTSQAGITLVALIITIVIMLILASTAAINVNTGAEYKNYKKMCADIEILQEKVLLYYQKYGEVPTKGESIDVSSIQGIKEEVGEYFEIDLRQLSSSTLNYGIKQEADDIYIINNISLNVYYLKGINYNENVEHSI